jgi:CHASE3 domain sensor protein
MAGNEPDQLDKELDALLAGSGPHAPEFRLKVREIINSELAYMREELHVQVKSQLDSFSGGLQTQLTKVMTDASITAARRAKSYIDQKLTAPDPGAEK